MKLDTLFATVSRLDILNQFNTSHVWKRVSVFKCRDDFVVYMCTRHGIKNLIELRSKISSPFLSQDEKEYYIEHIKEMVLYEFSDIDVHKELVDNEYQRLYIDEYVALYTVWFCFTSKSEFNRYKLSRPSFMSKINTENL